jgi:hypothetical protein
MYLLIPRLTTTRKEKLPLLRPALSVGASSPRLGIPPDQNFSSLRNLVHAKAGKAIPLLSLKAAGLGRHYALLLDVEGHTGRSIRASCRAQEPWGYIYRRRKKHVPDSAWVSENGEQGVVTRSSLTGMRLLRARHARKSDHRSLLIMH